VRKLVACAVLLLTAALGTTARGGQHGPVIRPGAVGVEMAEASEVNAWASTSPWWEIWNLSSGKAYARSRPYRNDLEAMSQCQGGRGVQRSAARATFRFLSQYHGPVSVQPVGQVHGQLVAYGAAGTGGADTKLTFQVRDLTSDRLVVDAVLLSESSPSLAVDVMAKGERAENRVSGGLGAAHIFHANPGHLYEATVKLWTECWNYGIYGSRADFSRHTLSTPAEPLIGLVRVNFLVFDTVGPGRR
jgi:hypothetical protein